MTENLEFRNSTPEDWPAIVTLYRDAFPNEDLAPLVWDLLQEPEGILSLVGIIRSDAAYPVACPPIVCHVIFTRCSLTGSLTPLNIALLGPLAVARAWQRKGCGSAIVRHGLQHMLNDGVACVCVLGNPAYYGRFGFLPETAIRSPYTLPIEWHAAWQSIYLGSNRIQYQGTLSVPQPWQRPELWLP